MREKQVCTELINSLKQAGAFAFKVPDAPISHMQSAETPQMRFSPPKAVDILAIYKGRGFAIEAKLITSGGGLSMERMRPKEAETLAQAAAAGGEAWLAIAYAFKPGVRAQAELGKWVREMWMLSWDRWLALCREATTKTVTRAAIVGASLGVPWAGKGLWDLDEFLDEKRSAKGAETLQFGL